MDVVIAERETSYHRYDSYYLISTMHILIVNNHTIHIHEIHTIFPSDAFFTYISYSQVWGYNFEPFDCIILTGSSNHTYEYKMFAKEIHIIKELNKPIIWICLGSELITESYGGIIAKNQSRIEGNLSIRCIDDHNTNLVHEAHRFSIIALGEELDWLAKSDYWYEIIKHKHKPILWFQFHPEVTVPSNDWLRLFMKYKNILGLW